MDRLELMSPAGSLESIYAAARAGADAIYFGGGDFNARRNAKNLSNEELLSAIKYLNERKIRSYITINTLLTDRELTELVPFVRLLARGGVSAVIVQDLGVAKMVHESFPELAMHASTQLTVCDLAGAVALKKLGFSRVVLARELPLSEIEFISKNCGIETEIFCHGALCMSYSGQCYLSSAIGGRSGNRGLCAQPCRMQYNFFGEAPTAHLSLKDMCLASQLDTIAAAGVACIKIEGRMKRPEYTALVTSIYKKAILEKRAPTRAEMEKLTLMFSRGGFTDGYFTDKCGAHMFGTKTEENERDLKALYKEINDTICAHDPLGTAVDMHFTATSGQPICLTCKEHDGTEVSSVGEVPEKSMFKETTTDDIEQNLRKTGGTPFYAENVKCSLARGLRIPASAVNAMRRECLDKLCSIRTDCGTTLEHKWNAGYDRTNEKRDVKYIYSFLSTEQITDDVLKYNPAYIYLPLREIDKKRDFVSGLCKKGHKVAAVLDRVIFDREWEQFVLMLKSAKELGVNAVVCSNIGHAELLSSIGFELHGDFGLNIFNSQAMKQYKAMGITCQTLSFELNFAQIRDISKCCDSQIIVYGRLPLMITENCIIKKRGTGGCSCQSSGNALYDKTGRSFPLVASNSCRNTLYNSDKLFLADKRDEYVRLGLSYARLNFTIENWHECVSIAAAYEKDSQYVPERITRGLYIRGVE